MLDNNFDKETILKITALNEETLNGVIEDIKYDETKSDK